jgi:hypothetical protein
MSMSQYVDSSFALFRYIYSMQRVVTISNISIVNVRQVISLSHFKVSIRIPRLWTLFEFQYRLGARARFLQAIPKVLVVFKTSTVETENKSCRAASRTAAGWDLQPHMHMMRFVRISVSSLSSCRPPQPDGCYIGFQDLGSPRRLGEHKLCLNTLARACDRE